MPERAFYLWQVRSFTVRLALDVVETLALHLEGRRFNPAEEHGGLLFGRVIDNDIVEVTGFEFIRSKHHRGASYDLGDGERFSVERYVRSFSKRGAPKPVGYFRTHLRPGLFLDQSDFALMRESLSDIPGIALAIRTDRPGRWNAGIFFWEEGDMDRRRTELMFPFDAATLRVQGPVEQKIQQPAITGVASAWASKLETHSASLLLGTAALLALAAIYEIPPNSGGAQRIDDVSVHSAAPPTAATARPALVQPEMKAVSNTPPAAEIPNSEVPNTYVEAPDRTYSLSPVVRSPSDISEPQAASPAMQLAPNVQPTLNTELAPAAVAPISPPAPALPAASVSSPAPEVQPAPISPPASDSPPAFARNSASLPARTSVSAPEPVPPVAPVKGVLVEVSLEPREPSGLKRIAGHVPLLGHLHPFRNETGRDFVSARPAASLKPRVPASMTRSLEGEIAVDVVVSIDNQGLVKNTEITKGAETSLAMLAADAVRSAPWEPAHSGDRNVAMDMVVHYRFNPAE
jgi:hypothetical protein